MNINGADSAFVGISILAALASAVFWMVVGWRAMLAHERLASATESIAHKARESDRS